MTNAERIATLAAALEPFAKAYEVVAARAVFDNVYTYGKEQGIGLKELLAAKQALSALASAPASAPSECPACKHASHTGRCSVMLSLDLRCNCDERTSAPESGTPESSWQPIETAPKDGTAVLLHNNDAPGLPSGHPDHCSDINTVVGSWWSGETGPDGEDGDWMCYMSLPHEPHCPFAPTHWMPLPDPPKESA